MGDSSFLSLNINGAGDVKKRLAIFEYIKSFNRDIILLQETHTTIVDEVPWKLLWRGEIIFSHLSSNSAGIAILFKPMLHITDLKSKSIFDGRCIHVSFTMYDVTYNILNIYAPTDGKERYTLFLLIFDYMKLFDDDSMLIFGGDFNCTLLFEHCTLLNIFDRQGHIFQF